MEKIYIRKIFPHDITHEISVRSDIVNSFFEGKTKGLSFIGKESGHQGLVTINNATDPRFGGEFKSIVLDEGRINVNDILLIYKIDALNYIIEVVKKGDEKYLDLIVMFRQKDRHAFLSTTDLMNIDDL